MKLPPARVGPYVRALATGLHRLAPNQDFRPLAQMAAHLRALDPALSGELLQPAEVDERTGMPAYSWLERARAEAVLAQEHAAVHSEAELSHAERLDPALGARLRHRSELHAFLVDNPVLDGVNIQARARRLAAVTEVLLTYDRVEPIGIWSRVAITLTAPRGTKDLGCATVSDNGRITLDRGLSHLLSRHGSTPLMALRKGLGAVTEGEVTRLCRSRIGPFWFPGISVPPSVPQSLGAGLLLHASSELVAQDVHRSAERDPLADDLDDALPEGYGVVRERRFAASAGVGEAVRRWSAERGFSPEIVALS